VKRINPVQGLAAGASAVTVALTGTAFWLSYEHLHDVADANGLEGARAWAWPGTVDMFIVAGELLILRAALRGRFDWFAYLLAAVGSLGSIALNVAGVGWGASPLEYVVAAVPPVAALLAFAAVMRQVHERLAGHVEAEVLDVNQTLPVAEVTTERADDDQPTDTNVSVGEPLEVVTPPVIELPAAVPVWDDFEVSKVTTPEPARRQYRLDSFAEQLVPVDDTEPVTPQSAAVPAETTRQVVTEPVGLNPSELRRKARQLHRQVVRSGGRGVTIDQLRDEFGLSRRDATELRREVVTEVAS
jgi:hypothetical protein